MNIKRWKAFHRPDAVPCTSNPLSLVQITHFADVYFVLEPER